MQVCTQNITRPGQMLRVASVWVWQCPECLEHAHGDDVKTHVELACRMVAVASWSQVSGGAGRIVQLASLCCRQSRTSSVICSTLHRKGFAA